MKSTSRLFWIILIILVIILAIAIYKNYNKNKVQDNANSPVNPVGKVAYANNGSVKVYTDSSLSTLYKTAAKDEWIGTVLSVEGGLYKTSGNRYVYIVDTYLA